MLSIWKPGAKFSDWCRMPEKNIAAVLYGHSSMLTWVKNLLETPDPTIITNLLDCCWLLSFDCLCVKKVSDLFVCFAYLAGITEEHASKDRGEHWFVTLSFKQLACLSACSVPNLSTTGAHGIYGWFEMWRERWILVWNRRLVSSNEDGYSFASLKRLTSGFYGIDEDGWYSESVHLFHWGRWGLCAILSSVISRWGVMSLECAVYMFVL